MSHSDLSFKTLGAFSAAPAQDAAQGCKLAVTVTGLEPRGGVEPSRPSLNDQHLALAF